MKTTIIAIFLLVSAFCYSATEPKKAGAKAPKSDTTAVAKHDSVSSAPSRKKIGKSQALEMLGRQREQMKATYEKEDAFLVGQAVGIEASDADSVYVGGQ